ncbi:hypothetical protein F6A13_11145 [Acidithiobacillus sp. 'AMD consortium']|uniref:hypothetical protein n=1 Tax=Acidithiobacillus sp. 'AMD consortium' TaxID=2614801 RepID=UPI00017F7633|nr:hypothetical protein [Acidithiobacillus sp. 'AMD consortium']ACH84331.1 hypothetical protein Lferr_2125 [Acidithiobacillus ferrooxidans ATCC 53993]MDA8115021.1 hypothetical protein [Acidithiobacillus sp.]QLK42861.1 hypothetical protein FE661_12560 [Acidithiobacillus ferrooxidans]QFG79109.1 hypothetical protein F6A13_11145 [Acidithiobacillus sp. 'AMD consortium']BDB15188.1 hypothetical protein ANFP_25080 [Acidithiobacillus ferrooxidans]
MPFHNTTTNLLQNVNPESYRPPYWQPAAWVAVTDGHNNATDEQRMRTGLDGTSFFAAQTELNLVPDQREKKPFQMHVAR